MPKVHAVMYTKPLCPGCKATTRRMDEVGLPYENTYYGNAQETNVIDIQSDDINKRNWSEQKIDKLKETYHIQSLPFIKIIDDETGEMLDSWSGFRPSEITKWAKQNKS